MDDASVTSLFNLSGTTAEVSETLVTNAIIKSLSYITYDTSKRNDIIRLINRSAFYKNLVIKDNQVYRIANELEMGVVKQKPTLTNYTDDGLTIRISGDYKIFTRPYENIINNLKLVNSSYSAMGRRFDLDGSMKFIAKTSLDLNTKTSNSWIKKRNDDIKATVEGGDMVVWFKNAEEVQQIMPDYSKADMEAPKKLLHSMLAQAGIPPEFVLGIANDNQTMSFINYITASYLDALGITWTFDFSTTLSFISTAGYKYLPEFVKVDQEKERFSAELDVAVKEKEAMISKKYAPEPVAEPQEEKKEVEDGDK